MGMSPAGLRPEKDSAGEPRQVLLATDPFSLEERTNPEETPRQTDHRSQYNFDF
jgi:hypothetical protein